MTSDLEPRVHRVLRNLPDLKAPATLEARVQAALAARAALPWWRQSFGEWPSVARLAFVLVSLALIGVTVSLGVGAQVAAAPAQWLLHTEAFITSFGGLFALVGRLIPTGWLTAALVLGTALYTALFGLGAVLYRSLYLKVPLTRGMP